MTATVAAASLASATAVALSIEQDPIYAAIESYKMALQAHDEAFENEKLSIDDVAEGAYRTLYDARERLLGTPATTTAGLTLLVAFVRDRADVIDWLRNAEGDDTLRDFLNTIAKSVPGLAVQS